MIGSEHGRALCDAALAMADRARATAIVAVTQGGLTARMLAALRPGARIIAVTPNARAASALSLVWGVTPIVTDQTALPAIRDLLVARSLLPTGAVVVFVAVSAVLGQDGANFVRVERL
jgi:pyruvate kinase